MIHACLFGTAVAFMVMSVAAPAVNARPVPHYVKPHTAYDPDRPRLKHNGWRKIGYALREPGSCPSYDDRCRKYLEARECSGTGLGFCNMVWKHRDGTVIVITTAGEEQLIVQSIKRQ